MILQPHKHAFRSILLTIFMASFALFLFVNFRNTPENTALGVSCPAGIAGQMDLCPSTRIPHQGDTVQFTVNTRQAQSGISVTIYIGGRPGSDGYITNPQIFTTGSTNSSGNFDFSYTVPSGDAWNTFHYFRAEATVGGSLLKSNQVALTVIPKTTDADWILTPTTYCQVQTGGNCTPINNSYPLDKVYPLAATGDVILLEDGQYNHAEFKRSCHSQTGPMIWVMARNINGPVFNPNPVGSSDTISFNQKSCWTTLVGLKIMGDDRAGVHFVTSTNNGPYLNDQFLEVTIDGGWDYYNNSGTTAKWGFQSYGLQGFRYVGGEVKNVGDMSVGEHAFYMHNPDTDATGNAIELRDVNSSNVGRTYVQIVNRPDDCSYANPCPPGSGIVTIEHAVIKNTGLEGNCTGGSSLTFGGRNDYNIIVSNTYVESGLDTGLSCKGTGEFVTWDGNNVPAENNGPTTVRNSYFIMAPNQGNKPLSEIGTVDSITIEKSTFISGKTYSMNAKKSAVTKCFDRDSNITGNPEKRVTVDGVDYANYQAMLDALGDCGSSGGNPTVTLSATDANASETAGDPGTYTISRTGSTANSLSVKFSVSGTATNGTDYNQINSPVTIPAGASSVTVQLSPIDDTSAESSETAILTLNSDPLYIIGSPSSGTVTIADNDSGGGLPTVTVSTTDANASETAGDTGTIKIIRTGSTASSLTVYFSISGTATNGSDYSSISSPITIPSGTSTVAIQISPIDDTSIESSETAIITITSNASYTIGSPSSGTVTITDNDSSSTPTVSLTTTDSSASEAGLDPGSFTLSRTGATTNPLTVSVSISGTATNGTDYNQIISPITIPAGLSSTNINITPVDDISVENTETAVITINSDPSYIIGSPNTGTVNILDNDGVPPPPLPTISVIANDPTSSEPGSDTGSFTVSRTGSTTNSLTIIFTMSGTATNGSDYQQINSPVTIPVGFSSVFVNLTPLNDSSIENTESATLTISPDSSYSIGSPNSASVDILDDDSAPPPTPIVSIAANDPTASELGLDNGIITISRNGSTISPLTVSFIISGDAINGTDYNQIFSSATIGSGLSSVSINLTPINDTIIENTETITLTIASDPNYVIDTQNTATVNILDDDNTQPNPPPPPTNPTNTQQAPSNFSGLALSPSKIYLSWNLVSGASGIELSESSDNITFGKIYNLPGNYYYYKLDVVPGSTHYYRVRSYDSSGSYSSYSNSTQVSTSNSTSQFTKLLYQGVSDKEVSILQECLKTDSTIYPTGKITGYFGPLTETAVRNFQNKYGINSIGIVGPLTRAKLNTVCSPSSTSYQSPAATALKISVNFNLSFDTILGLGSSGDQVSLLQAVLAKNPSLYPSGIISGYFGPLTETAVKNFQNKYGIEPLGTVGTKTIIKLNEIKSAGINP